MDEIDFCKVNLLVGKNATGKSRVLHVVWSLSNILAGRQSQPLSSGIYVAEFELGHGTYNFTLECRDNCVVKEELSVNGVVVLSRGADGKGQVWFDSEQKNISFDLDPRQFALPTRRDDLQHPFAVELAAWATGVAYYQFGSDFGKSSLMDQNSAVTSSSVMGIVGQPAIVPRYIAAYGLHGDEFDQAIISDMKAIGYSISAVHAMPLPRVVLQTTGAPPLTLTVSEEGVEAAIPQVLLSQGMYRALALIIHLNIARFSGTATAVLVDDIGEGLDYDRASRLIELAISHAKLSSVQLIMTSNDRFVMNQVPLEHWAVLERQKQTVRAHTARTSPQVFKDFQFLGMSNFDFFAAGRYH